jgi:CRISPR-associated endonuclease/helicase Cas3
MLDVAAVASALLEYCPSDEKQLGQWFGLPADAVRHWLATLTGLHDFGKAIPGFQAKWAPGMLLGQQAGLIFSPEICLKTDRHDAATSALLPKCMSGIGLPYDWVAGVVQAVSAHHGFNFLDGQAIRPVAEPDIWKQTRQQVFDVYWQALSPESVPFDQSLSLACVQWLAGLTSVSDWIGSNSEWFPPGERDETLTGHFAKARAIAFKVLAEPDKLGWPPLVALLQQPAASSDALIARILNADQHVTARPLQRVADELLSGGQGPCLMVVEAPMGEGKTELAFLASLRLQAREQHRGMYLALPTQATGNAMFERTLKFLRSFAGDSILDIQLAHSGAAMNETVARLRDIWGTSRDEAVRSSAWFAQKRRGLLSPYGVGTVDQGLFGVMNVKHHFVRLWGLANKVVVLDEVHAYDAYTGNLIETLLRWLKQLGCSVILMSATLPDKKREALLQAWDVAGDFPDYPYPRVLLADGKGVRGGTFIARQQAPIRVSGLDESLASIATQAREALEEGGCGAVIVNTVDRAQQLYRDLVDRVPADTVLQLFHARFPADERQTIEKAVLNIFGSQGPRPGRALLIATQVAEQSLDIDFDFLISDLAPVDLLLQRAGRLHRHQREHRPAAHSQPHLKVAGLLPERLPDLETTNWGRIYGDYLCLVTWAMLLNEPVWRLPGDIDRLVQAVYAPWPTLPALAAEIVQKIEDVSRIEHKALTDFQAQLARHVAIDPREQPEYAYIDKPHGADEDDMLALRNQTRLGSESITAIPVWVDADGQWRVHANSTPFDSKQPVNDVLARQLYNRQIKISRKALLKHLQAQAPCPAWAEHPLLDHYPPLLLQDGVCRIGKLSIRLDPKLGLVYSSETPQELP